MVSKEDRATTALVDLVNDADPATRRAVVLGLLAGVPAAHPGRAAAAAAREARLLTGADRPDCVLLDDDQKILAVVEHKQRAQDSCVPLAPYRAWSDEAFRDGFAQGFLDMMPGTDADDPHTHPDRRTWQEHGCERGCQVHKTVRGTTSVVAGVSQLDRYRVFRRWVDASGLQLDRADDVPWLVLDARNRPLPQISNASWAVEAGKWHTTGYDQLLPALSALQPTARAIPDGQHIKALLVLTV